MVFLLITAGCGPRSLDEFEEEGEGVIRSLIQELQAIHTREQLIAASGRLKRQFERLAGIMIAAQEYVVSHPELGKEKFVCKNHELSDRLRIELNRIYRLEGGRQIIEKCEESALQALKTGQIKA